MIFIRPHQQQVYNDLIHQVEKEKKIIPLSADANNVKILEKVDLMRCAFQVIRYQNLVVGERPFSLRPK